MAWNGSGSGNGKAEEKKNVRSSTSTSTSTFNYKALIAGLIVILIGGLVAWLTLGRAQTPVAPKERKSVRITEVKPHIPTSRPVAVAEPEPRKLEYWEQPTTNGLSPCQILKWKHMREKPPVYTNNCFVTAAPQPYAIFPSRVENELAMLLTVEPGTVLVGSPDYGEEFQKAFIKSCETPIIITSSDSEYDKELKKAMRELKIELCDRINAGENIGDIVRDSRNEMMRLWVAKQDLIQETHRLIKETAETDRDVDDYITSLNKVLESKGMSPIEMDPLTKQSLLLQLGFEVNENVEK